MNFNINISDYDYDLPEERIAKFPLDKRELSKLLVYREGKISESLFNRVGGEFPDNPLLIFNNTKVIRARLIMHRPTGARVEIFCLEPHRPFDYERALSAKGECEWSAIVGNLRRWKSGPVEVSFDFEGKEYKLQAYRVESEGKEQIVRFEWSADLAFGQLLEHLGKIPIPPYLNRESEEIDNSRYQTVYSKFEGSVAAPTAGLHFSESMMEQLTEEGVLLDEVTLHVGAGTFLPVKEDNVSKHHMHTEHFGISQRALRNLIEREGSVVAVGTTTVRSIESLPVLGYRVMESGDPDVYRAVGQWESYDIPAELSGRELLGRLLDYMERENIEMLRTATQIMILPGFRFRVTNQMITNFHQPKSTLLLLVSAFVGEDWRKIYSFAMENDFRFLSYGDSSILIPKRG